MSKIVPFRPRRTEADIAALTTSIFKFIADCDDLPPKLLRKAFLLTHPELTTADFMAGFQFARRILAVFEKLVVERPNDGGAA